MRVTDKTSVQLLKELTELRQRVAHLEALEAERKHTEEALRQSNERYRTLIETIPHGIEEMDASGIITIANAAHHRQYEYGEGELIGMSILDLVATDSEREELRNYLRYLVKEQPVPVPYFGKKRTKKGRVVDVQVAWEYKRGAQGQVTGFTSVITDITERRRAERTLQETSQNLQAIIETSPVPIIAMDPEGQITIWNPAAEHVFGWSKGEVLGSPLPFLPEDKQEEHRMMRQRVLRGEKLAGVEVRRQKKDGSPIDISFSTSLLHDPDGRISGIMGVVVDVTDRKRAEETLRRAHEELEARVRERTVEISKTIGMLEYQIEERKRAQEAMQESEGRLRRLLETTNAIPWEANAKTWQFTYVGPQAVKLLGYPVEQWCEKDFWVAHIHPEDREHAVEFCLKASHRYKDYEFEYRLIAADGRVLWIHDIVNVVSVDGVPETLRGFMIDITPWKQAGQALRESEEKYRVVAETATDAIITLDENSRIIYANPATEQIFGYTVDELLGQPLTNLMPESLRSRHVAALKKFVDTEQKTMSWEGREFVGIHRSGRHIPIEISFGALRQGNGAILFTGIVRDITERKKAEEALREQTEHIRLLQKITVAANEASIVEEAMQVCLDEVCALTEWPVGHAYVLADDGTDELVSAKLWHLDRPKQFETFRRVTEDTRFKPGIGFPGRVLLSGKSAWIVDVNKDPNFPRVRVAEDIGVKASFAFPVLVGKDVVAVLEFFSPEAVDPDQRLLDVMAHVGTQLGRVIERKRLEKEILEASEQEQRRIGQDLHDGLSQHLTGVAFLSKGLAHKLDTKSKTEAAEAAKIAHLINQAIVQTRDLARGLYPVNLEATGLGAALHELADQVATIFKISCRFRWDDSILVRDNTKATHLYYIAREAVNNAIKHGKAQAVVIGLDRVKDRVILTVKDDGIGLPEEVERTKGMGLHTMNHRARMIGASLAVKQDPAGGTMVACSFKTDQVERKGRGRHDG